MFGTLNLVRRLSNSKVLRFPELVSGVSGVSGVMAAMFPIGSMGPSKGRPFFTI